MAKIVIMVYGGAVQDVLTEEETEILIIDQDVDGNEEDVVPLVDVEMDPFRGRILEIKDLVWPEKVEHFWKQIPTSDGIQTYRVVETGTYMREVQVDAPNVVKAEALAKDGQAILVTEEFDADGFAVSQAKKSM